jgi:hypothetical protein
MSFKYIFLRVGGDLLWWLTYNVLQKYLFKRYLCKAAFSVIFSIKTTEQTFFDLVFTRSKLSYPGICYVCTRALGFLEFAQNDVCQLSTYKERESGPD